MSPEQARGAHSLLDQRSDLYSFGVIFYEMLTRRRPYRTGDADFAQKLQFELPPPPRDLNALLPARLSEICMKCLAKSRTTGTRRPVRSRRTCWHGRPPVPRALRLMSLIWLLCEWIASPRQSKLPSLVAQRQDRATSSLGAGPDLGSCALAAATGNPFKYLPKPGNVRITTNPPEPEWSSGAFIPNTASSIPSSVMRPGD